MRALQTARQAYILGSRHSFGKPLSSKKVVLKNPFEGYDQDGDDMLS